MAEVILPIFLKIGAHQVRILFPYVFKERHDLDGQYDKAVAEIKIAGKDESGNLRVESEIWVTLFHEILHAIDCSTGHDMFTGERGENRIEGISEGLYQVLNDNGLLNKPKTL